LGGEYLWPSSARLLPPQAARDRLRREIAALTEFGAAREGQDEADDGAYEDGTNALDGLRSAGEGWVVEGGEELEPMSRSGLRMAEGVDFEDDRRYQGKRASRDALPGLRGEAAQKWMLDWTLLHSRKYYSCYIGL
jgi:hypothetical protein